MPLLYKTVSIEFAASEVDSRNTRLVSIAFIGLYIESVPKKCQPCPLREPICTRFFCFQRVVGLGWTGDHQNILGQFGGCEMEFGGV